MKIRDKNYFENDSNVEKTFFFSKKKLITSIESGITKIRSH